MRLLWIFALWIGLCGPVFAQNVDISRLMANLPERTIKELQRKPEKFIEDAAVLIMGFGGEAGIDLAGINASINLDRAWVRAREMRRLMVADLDNDYIVTLAEIRVLIAAERAGKRGLLLLGFQAADLDGDAVVTQVELQSHAQARAMAAFTVEDAARLHAFMGFDLNGDGLVQIGEVVLVVEAFVPKA
ncbi:hypothetical protein [Profundibacter sp.]